MQIAISAPLVPRGSDLQASCMLLTILSDEACFSERPRMIFDFSWRALEDRLEQLSPIVSRTMRFSATCQREMVRIVQMCESYHIGVSGRAMLIWATLPRGAAVKPGAGSLTTHALVLDQSLANSKSLSAVHHREPIL